MKSLNLIKAKVSSIEKMLNAKILNLSSGVRILCSGYHALKGTEYVESQYADTPSRSINQIRAVMNCIGKTTGYNHKILNHAVRSLCLGYEDEYLYSFGVLSDLHIQYETGTEDLTRALSYLNQRVPFTCVCGDLVSFADESTMSLYKKVVDENKGKMEVYECAGNHETYPSLGVSGNIDSNLWTSTTGKQLYYSFTHRGDVFIMFGMKSVRADDLFPEGALEWLEATLEENKDKRCFVFQHAPEMADICADPSGTWSVLMNGTSGKAFVDIIKRYNNLVWFHGHTHLTLGTERYPLSDNMGYSSVHIPSLVSPRFYKPEISDTLIDCYPDENGNPVWGSSLAEGYIVEVYKNRIVLQGINFAAGDNKGEVQWMENEVYTIGATGNNTL